MKWISVIDRLPTDRKNVLFVWRFDDRLNFGSYNSQKGVWCTAKGFTIKAPEKVKFWLEILELPKELAKLNIEE